jgi:hypothetical protein
MALTLGTNCGFVSSAPSTDPAGSSFNIGGYAAAVKHVSPTGNYKVIEIGWYRNSTSGSARDMQVAIFTDSSGPSVQVGSTSEASFTDSIGWKKISSLNISLNSATNYWIAVQVDNDGGYCDYASSGGSGFIKEGSGTLTDMPSSWGSVDEPTGKCAIYALVEEVATGTNAQVNIGDVWKSISAMQINIGDTWKPVAGAKVNIGDVWKTIF